MGLFSKFFGIGNPVFGSVSRLFSSGDIVESRRGFMKAFGLAVVSVVAVVGSVKDIAVAVGDSVVNSAITLDEFLYRVFKEAIEKCWEKFYRESCLGDERAICLTCDHVNDEMGGW